MRFIKIFICFLSLVCFQDASCQTIAELNAKIATLETKVVVLETKVSILEENNKALNLRIDNILLNLKSGINNVNPEGKASSNNNSLLQQNAITTPKVTTPDRVNNSSGGQCSATTKKGSRCSRKASSNGYCWQHGGN
jgi:hypothetical protein